MYNMNSVDKTIESLRNELLELTVGLEKQAGNMKVLQERIAAFKTQSDRLKNENAALEQQKQALSDEFAAVSERQRAFEEQSEQKEKEEEKIKADYMATVARLTEKESEQQFNQQSLLEAMDKPLVVCDRSYLDTLVYSQYLYEKGKISIYQMDLLKRMFQVMSAMVHFDKVFLLKPSFELQAEENRSMNEEFQRDIYNMFDALRVHEPDWEYLPDDNELQNAFD